MTVLYILGVIFAIVALLSVVAFINALSEKLYEYQFFSFANLVIVGIAYALLYFGWSWYNSALTNNGDSLNGLLLMAFGSATLTWLVGTHIKHTSFYFGLFFSLVQLAIYVPAVISGGFALLLAVAWLSDTKPVYKI